MRPSVVKGPRITGVDVSLTDIIVPVAGSAALGMLVEKYDLRPGGKRAIDDHQLTEFTRAAYGREVGAHPGGSVGNMMVTMGKLLNGAAHLSFFSAVGGGQLDHHIRTSFKEAKVELLETQSPQKPQSATSYVLLLPNGERTIVTHGGNARDVLSPDHMPQNMVAGTDKLLMAGSLWQKLKWDAADRFVDMHSKGGKDLWLALPTNVEFAIKNRDHFQGMMPSTKILLGNTEELNRITGKGTEESLRFVHHAFRFLHQGASSAVGGNANSREPVAFITDGSRGAYVVTPSAAEPIFTPAVRDVKVVNTLGAGDTAFGGFLAGYEAGLPLQDASRMAMVLAAAKIATNDGARLKDPAADLLRASPTLARTFFKAVENMPHRNDDSVVIGLQHRGLNA